MSRILENWDTIVSYMNDELREDLHAELAPCSEAEFLSAYLKREEGLEGEDLKGILENEFNIDEKELNTFLSTSSLVFTFEACEDGNILRADGPNYLIKATCEVPEGASEDFGYLTLKQSIIDEIGTLGLELVFPYDDLCYENKLADDASADVDVDLFIDLNMPLYRIIDRIGDGDVFESIIYTDKDMAIRDCESEWATLTEHDRQRRSAHYVAEYDCYDDAQEVLADHNTVYDSMLGWADNLLNYTGLNRKDFCARYNIPYNTYEKWMYGSRECPEYVRELLERAVHEDF